jgi:putative metalloprotease
MDMMNDVEIAVSALIKLSTLGNGHFFLSSHPAPEARAKRLHEMAKSPQKTDEPSKARRITGWLKGNLPSGVSGNSLFMNSRSDG